MTTEWYGSYVPHPYLKYRLEVEKLLENYAKIYDRNGPAHGHDTTEQQQASYAITKYITENWKDDFYQYQYNKLPEDQRLKGRFK